MRKPVPGPLFTWVKWLSWIELGIFSLLILFWLVPGFDTETMLFGWAHGLGFVVLCIVIWVACGKRQAPYTLLAATLTPVGRRIVVQHEVTHVASAASTGPASSSGT